MLGFFEKREVSNTNKLRETEDYVLVSIEDEDCYYIFNKITHNLEDQEMKLPTSLFQIDALQSALDKYREGNKES